MTEQRGMIVLRWAWLVLAVVSLLVCARMARYTPAGDGYYWDRWAHRECEAVDGGLDCSATGNGSVQTAVGAGRGVSAGDALYRSASGDSAGHAGLR
jgi:hypothetical protein